MVLGVVPAVEGPGEKAEIQGDGTPRGEPVGPNDVSVGIRLEKRVELLCVGRVVQPRADLGEDRDVHQPVAIACDLVEPVAYGDLEERARLSEPAQLGEGEGKPEQREHGVRALGVVRAQVVHQLVESSLLAPQSDEVHHVGGQGEVRAQPAAQLVSTRGQSLRCVEVPGEERDRRLEHGDDVHVVRLAHLGAQRAASGEARPHARHVAELEAVDQVPGVAAQREQRIARGIREIDDLGIQDEPCADVLRSAEHLPSGADRVRQQPRVVAGTGQVESLLRQRQAPVACGRLDQLPRQHREKPCALRRLVIGRAQGVLEQRDRLPARQRALSLGLHLHQHPLEVVRRTCVPERRLGQEPGVVQRTREAGRLAECFPCTGAVTSTHQRVAEDQQDARAERPVGRRQPVESLEGASAVPGRLLVREHVDRPGRGGEAGVDRAPRVPTRRQRLARVMGDRLDVPRRIRGGRRGERIGGVRVQCRPFRTSDAGVERLRDERVREAKHVDLAFDRGHETSAHRLVQPRPGERLGSRPEGTQQARAEVAAEHGRDLQHARGRRRQTCHAAAQQLADRDRRLGGRGERFPGRRAEQAAELPDEERIALGPSPHEIDECGVEHASAYRLKQRAHLVPREPGELQQVAVRQTRQLAEGVLERRGRADVILAIGADEEKRQGPALGGHELEEQQ